VALQQGDGAGDRARAGGVAKDFSLYLHAPTRSDASLAPPGQEAFYVLSPVPNNRSGVDWEAEREPYFERVLQELEKRLLPGIRGSIATSLTLTPREFERDLRSVDGAAFGPEPVLTQSAWFRYHNRSDDVAGLYFVGAGTHPGGGVPGVLNSAKVLERIAPRPARPVPLPGLRRGRINPQQQRPEVRLRGLETAATLHQDSSRR
jgi:phytoene desaturase